MAGRSLALAALLALPATASASTTDADRFARFAKHARATGAVQLVLRFQGTKQAGCEDVGTCGVAGKVTAKVALDPSKPITQASKTLLVLPARGSTEAIVTGPSCHTRLQLRTLGLGFTPDNPGILLRPGAIGSGSRPADPFLTACNGPTLKQMGNEKALPAARLKSVPADPHEVRISFAARRQEFFAAGYECSVVETAKIRLRRK